MATKSLTVLSTEYAYQALYVIPRECARIRRKRMKLRKYLFLAFTSTGLLGFSAQSQANGSVFGNLGYFEPPWSILIGYSDHGYGYSRPHYVEHHHYYHKHKRHHYYKPHHYYRGHKYHRRHNYGHYRHHDYYKPYHYRSHKRHYRHKSHYHNGHRDYGRNGYKRDKYIGDRNRRGDNEHRRGNRH